MDVRNRAASAGVIFATVLVGCAVPSVEGTPLVDRSNAGADELNAGRGDDDDEESVGNDDVEDMDAPGSGGKGDGVCSGESTAASCLDCCKERNPESFDVFAAAFKTCVCDDPGPCAAECGASFCGDTKPDAACATCLEGAASACEDRGLSACDGDPSCSPLLQCATDSGCTRKK